ncbi:glutaredoxin [Mycena floridula]|nr:glutaredoxin [Mycena floridula]
MSISNFHQITETSQFQSLLSADLNRVSVLNFWAPWAEPCTQMNEVVKELAKKWPTLLFLEIEAESQSDIAESFDIEAVPAFVILRGHALLARISGADAPALTAAVAQHAMTPSITPRSKTDASPAKPSNDALPSEKDVDAATSIALKQPKPVTLDDLVKAEPVVLFMKGSPSSPRCGFSRKIVALLKDQGVQYGWFDILSDDHVRQGLKVRNNWPTFPQLMANGELLGGLDIVQELAENGELLQEIEGAGKTET